MNSKMIIPLILVIILVVLFIDNNKLNTQLNETEEKYTELKSNSKTQVEDDAEDFLKGFYNYEDRPKLEQIENYASKDLQKELFQTYELIDEKEIDIEIDYKSEIENIYIYHAQDIYDSEKQAYVLARFDSIVTLDGNMHETVVFSEITMKKENNKWLVTKYKQLKGVDEFEGN